MKLKPYMVVGGFGVFALMALVFFAVLLVAVFSGGDGDDSEAQVSPTPPSVAQTQTISPTPATSVANASSPTPLSTAVSVIAPTPTPLRFATSAPPPTVQASTGNANNNNNQNTQTAFGISSPTGSSTVQGNIAVIGSASSPNFIQYALEYGPEPNGSNLWYPITSVPITQSVLNSTLGAWNTRTVPDGNYQIRLHVWLQGGIEEFRVINNVQVQNSNAQQSNTNNNPSLTPISNLEITQGKAVTISLGISDPDGDPTTYITQISNPNIATITPSGASAITVNALNTGTTNVSVSVSDGRGGTASAAFAVTVNAPEPTNNAPSITQIPAQAVLAGQALNVNVAASDSDQGDTVTLTAASASPSVATASIAGQTLTISGVSQGTAGINVTATDSGGLSSVVSFTVTVTTPVINQAPAVQPVGSQSLTAGTILDIPLDVSDPDGDPLTVSATSDNDGIVTALVVGNNSVQLNGVSGGSATITVRADDLKGGSASISFTAQVTAAQSANNAPTLDPLSDQTIDQGQSVDISVVANDADGDVVSVGVSAAPSGIVAVSAVGNTVTVTGDNGGTATVTVTASDGKDSVSTTFDVTVNQLVAQNTAPTVDQISSAACTEGDSITVGFTYSDPDGETPSVVTPVASDNPNAVTIDLQDANTLAIDCVTAGTANITVVVQDAAGLTGSNGFAITVDPLIVNTAPVVDAISSVTCTVDDAPTVSFTYSDADGDALTVNPPTSDNQGIATVSLLDNNTVSVNCVAEGSATIGVSVSDAEATGSGSFGITVNAAAPPPNTAPVLDAISSATCSVGDNPTVSFTYSDADGDGINVGQPTSDNPAIASVSLLDNNNLSINCAAEGTVTITVPIDDGTDSASTTFGITVNAAAPPPNTAPVLDAINGGAGVTCTVGENPSVQFTYSDADGDPLTVNEPTSDNPAVASVSLFDNNTLSISCVAEGTANIGVSVTDNVDTASGGFAVTVSAAQQQPTFDVTTFPETPDINAISQTLSPIYSNGQNVGNQQTSFTVVGDQSAASLLGAFAAGPYTLGNNGDLQTLIDFYTLNGAPDNTFNDASVAVGDGWSIENLFRTDLAPQDCGGATPLQCELAQSAPVVVFVSFTPSNATLVPVGDFQANLQNIVSTATSVGTIPVLVGLPNDGTVDAATLAQYNEAIVTIATNANVPFWNLFNTMAPIDPSQVYASSGNPADLSDAALQFGENRRSLAGLRILQSIKNTFFP